VKDQIMLAKLFTAFENLCFQPCEKKQHQKVKKCLNDTDER